MASSLQPVIEAVRTKLLATAAVTSLLVNSTAIYDHVTSGQTGLYIEIGDGFEDDDDTFGLTGKRAQIFVTIWDSARTWKNIGSVETAVSDALDRATLTVTGHTFIFCQHVRTDRIKETDEIRKSDMQFEVLTKES